ncbi:MAG: stalk domain-containing protein [Bacillota bacterium]|nr:stalk domain-containing protein [Bacillota bacterium]
MKFIKRKIFIIITIFLTVVCFAAVCIAVSISATMLDRRNQIVGNDSSKAPVAVKISDKIINLSKTREFTFFFNGERLNGISAYVIDKNEFMVPMDAILDKLGIKFSYYSSDDVLETSFNGKKLTLKMYSDTLSYGGKDIKLSMSPVASNGHVFVPVSLFSGLEGFKAYEFEDNKTAFLNYYKGIDPKTDGQLKFFRLVNGTAQISDISGLIQFWNRKGTENKDEKYYFSGSGNTAILKSGSKIYIVYSGGKIDTYKVSIDPNATLSMDGKYLYWIDEQKNTSYIYDIADDYISKLGNYYFRIEQDDSDGYLLNGGTVLMDYSLGYGYKRVVLTNNTNYGNYMFIEKRNNVILEGNMDFSPNKQRVLHYRKDEGYYLADTDGSDMVYLGDGTEAKWITNNKIYLRTSYGAYIFSSSGEKLTQVKSQWQMLGQTLTGDVFYTDGSSLYCETGNIDWKIMDLSWGCAYIYGQSANGPYVAVTSDSTDGVYFMNGKSAVKLGTASQLVKQSNAADLNSEYSNGILHSPDNTYYAALQINNSFVNLNLIKKDGSDFRQITLNGQVTDNNVKTRWITNRKLLVYTKNQGWIVDFSGSTKIYSWDEKQGSTIEGVTVK